MLGPRVIAMPHALLVLFPRYCFEQFLYFAACQSWQIRVMFENPLHLGYGCLDVVHGTPGVFWIQIDDVIDS